MRAYGHKDISLIKKKEIFLIRLVDPIINKKYFFL